MPPRRILSLWFPRLAAERALRHTPCLPGTPFALVATLRGQEILTSLTEAAEVAGLHRGQPLRDARAMCPDLVTRPRAPEAEAALIAALARWAGRFSPWVGSEGEDALMLDITGCAHLFGGETALLEGIAADCTGFGLSLRAGLADTPGAAWALARHGGSSATAAGPHGAGDAIEQEARATRSRAFRRRGSVGPAAGQGAKPASSGPAGLHLAAPGQVHAALAPLPVAALRLPEETVAGLARLGLRRIGDIAVLPRATLARRFGRDVLQRLDQALGRAPEPISPHPAPPRFAVRLTLPDPIGLPEDMTAAIDRLLPALCTRLARAGRGARRIELLLERSDHSRQELGFGLARPGNEPGRLRPLLVTLVERIDPGTGIERLRLLASRTEPLTRAGHPGPAIDAGEAGRGRPRAERIDDLVNRIGARLGLEAITRLHPAESHIPEKAALILAAAWSESWSGHWPRADAPGTRPALLFPPEPATPLDEATPPRRFRWRRQEHDAARVTGPERIAPEWWLDDPAWRSGPRDYWRVETEAGRLLWLFQARGGAIPGGWYVQGDFG